MKKAAEQKKAAKMSNEERRVETHETVLAQWASLWKRRWRRWPEGHTPASLTLWLWKFGHILEWEAGTVLKWYSVVFLLLVVPYYTVFFYEVQR